GGVAGGRSRVEEAGRRRATGAGAAAPAAAVAGAGAIRVGLPPLPRARRHAADPARGGDDGRGAADAVVGVSRGRRLGRVIRLRRRGRRSVLAGGPTPRGDPPSRRGGDALRPGGDAAAGRLGGGAFADRDHAQPARHGHARLGADGVQIPDDARPAVAGADLGPALRLVPAAWAGAAGGAVVGGPVRAGVVRALRADCFLAGLSLSWPRSEA